MKKIFFATVIIEIQAGLRQLDFALITEGNFDEALGYFHKLKDSRLQQAVLESGLSLNQSLNQGCQLAEEGQAGSAG